MQPSHWVTDGAGTPGPGTYVTPLQMKAYLKERVARPAGGPPSPVRSTDFARSVRGSRPTGSRPPPAHFKTWSTREGGALVQPPSPTKTHEGSTTPPHEGPTTTHDAPPTETPEANAEQRLYEAARDEAAEIVWKHRNPNAPQSSPNAPYAYPGPGRSTLQRPRLQRTRSRSVGPSDDAELDLQRAASKLRKRHSFGSQEGSRGSRSSSLQDPAADGHVHVDADVNLANIDADVKLANIDADAKLAKAAADLPPQRKTSGSHRKPSGSLFQNPHDHIYEETDPPPAPAPTPLAAEPRAPAPLPLGMRRNPFTRFQSVKSNSDPIVTMRRFDKYEIHRNEPTQSRNAGYTLNPRTPKSSLTDTTNPNVENTPHVRIKDGKEVRSDELRAATGFSLRNRSPKLPTPTMVSDAPGRPIVSFQKDYGVVELKEEKSILSPDPKPEPAAVQPVVPPPLEKANTDPALPTRKSVFERPTSRSAASTSRNVPSPSKNGPILSRNTPTPSPFERPASRSASPFDRPVIRSGTGSAPPMREFGPSASSASTTGARPTTPKSPFANRSPLGRFNTASSSQSTSAASVNADPYALPSKSETPPVPPDPYALPAKSSTPPVPTDPYALPPPSATPAPSTATSRPLPSRTRFTRPQSVSSIPTISVSDSPAPTHSRTGSIPSIGVTPPVPTIAVSDAASTTAPPRGRFSRVSTPSISVHETPSTSTSYNTDIPTIAVDEPATTRPLPSISATPPVPAINVGGSTTSPRPLPDPRSYNKQSASSPSTRTHWTPTTVRTGAQCTACALPISGRIVSAGGCRFHPTCFACYQCGEKLECVAFYPEPSLKHAARVDRIRARASGAPLPPLPGWDTPDKLAQLEDQDGTDESPRFYCHLDFHECFSPRCKSCKTPIEGEVIVACGAEWHAGHFFCAQCGDPFDSSTPFVEKDGYAWCVNCHTHRYSVKCRGCRKPVVDTVVKALGAEWHQACFVCVECNGPFDDGRYFLRGESQDPVCVRCEERRLKA